MRWVWMPMALSLAVAETTAATPLFRDHWQHPPLVKGAYLLAFDQGLQYAPYFFDAASSWNKSRDARTPGGAPQRYFTARSEFLGRYALTDWLELSLLLPLVDRHESRLYKAGAVGLGDVELGIQAVIFRHGAKQHPLFLDLGARFPTGSAALDRDTLGKTSSLPLGTGQTDARFGLRHLYQGARFRLSQEVTYLWRRPDLVPYLQSSTVAGNYNLRFGDELQYQAAWQWENSGSVHPYLGLAAQYRWSGYHDTVAADSSGNLTTASVRLPRGYLLTGALGLQWRWAPAFHFFAEGQMPLIGRNTPLLPVVEGLLGPTLWLGVGFAGY